MLDKALVGFSRVFKSFIWVLNLMYDLWWGLLYLCLWLYLFQSFHWYIAFSIYVIFICRLRLPDHHLPRYHIVTYGQRMIPLSPIVHHSPLNRQLIKQEVKALFLDCLLDRWKFPLETIFVCSKRLVPIYLFIEGTTLCQHAIEKHLLSLLDKLTCHKRSWFSFG